jgi:hypothetical protein
MLASCTLIQGAHNGHNNRELAVDTASHRHTNNKLLPTTSHTFYQFMELLYSWLSARVSSECLLIRSVLQAYIVENHVGSGHSHESTHVDMHTPAHSVAHSNAGGTRIHADTDTDAGTHTHNVPAPEHIGVSVASELLENSIPTYHLRVHTTGGGTDGGQKKKGSKHARKHGDGHNNDNNDSNYNSWHDERALAAACVCSAFTHAASSASSSHDHTHGSSNNAHDGSSDVDTGIHTSAEIHRMTGCGLIDIRSISDDATINAHARHAHHYVGSILKTPPHHPRMDNQDEHRQAHDRKQDSNPVMNMLAHTYKEVQALIDAKTRAADDIHRVCACLWRAVWVVDCVVSAHTHARANAYNEHDSEYDVAAVYLCGEVFAGMQSLMSRMTIANVANSHHLPDMPKLVDSYLSAMLWLMNKQPLHIDASANPYVGMVNRQTVLSAIGSVYEMLVRTNAVFLMSEQSALLQHRQLATGDRRHGHTRGHRQASTLTEQLTQLRHMKAAFHAVCVRYQQFLCAVILSSNHDTKHLYMCVHRVAPVLARYYAFMQTHSVDLVRMYDEYLQTNQSQTHVRTNTDTASSTQTTFTQPLQLELQSGSFDPSVYIILLHAIHTCLLGLNRQLHSVRIDDGALSNRRSLRGTVHTLCVCLLEHMHIQDVCARVNMFDCSIVMCVFHELSTDSLCLVHEYEAPTPDASVSPPADASHHVSELKQQTTLNLILRCLFANIAVTAFAYKQIQTDPLTTAVHKRSKASSREAEERFLAYPTMHMHPFAQVRKDLHALVSVNTQPHVFAHNIKVLSLGNEHCEPVSPLFVCRYLESFKHLNIIVVENTDEDFDNEDPDTHSSTAVSIEGLSVTANTRNMAALLNDVCLSTRLLMRLCASARTYSIDSQALSMLNNFVHMCVCNKYTLCACVRSAGDESADAPDGCVCADVCTFVKGHFLHQHTHIDNLLESIALLNRFQYCVHTRTAKHGKRFSRWRKRSKSDSGSMIPNLMARKLPARAASKAKPTIGSETVVDRTNSIELPYRYLVMFVARTLRSLVHHRSSAPEQRQAHQHDFPQLCRYVSVLVQTLRRDYTHILAHVLSDAAAQSTIFAHRLYWTLKVEVINVAQLQQTQLSGDDNKSTAGATTNAITSGKSQSSLATTTITQLNPKNNNTSNNEANASSSTKAYMSATSSSAVAAAAAQGQDQTPKQLLAPTWGYQRSLSGKDPLPTLAGRCIHTMFAHMHHADTYLVAAQYTNMMQIVNISAILFASKVKDKQQLKRLIKSSLEGLIESANTQDHPVDTHNIVSPVPTYLPTHIDRTIVSINTSSGRPMQSAAKCPFMLTFNTAPASMSTLSASSNADGSANAESTSEDPGGALKTFTLQASSQENASEVAQTATLERVPEVAVDGEDSCIFKVFDDCRQDALTIEVSAQELSLLHVRFYFLTAISCMYVCR